MPKRSSNQKKKSQEEGKFNKLPKNLKIIHAIHINVNIKKYKIT